MPINRPTPLAAALAGLILFSMPVSANYAGEADVLVYGGNAAGVAAAIQTARMGHSVILLEPGRFMGGMTTGGLGATDTGNPRAVSGIAREFYQRIFQYYQRPDVWKHETRADYAPRHRLAISENLGMHWFFEPHVARLHLEQLMAEVGVSVILNSPLDRSPGGIIRDGTKVRSIRTTDGRTYAARMFIDTTYEGDLMAAAGASFMVGRESNSRYGETLNGIVYLPVRRTAHIDPFVVPGDPSSGLLPRILPKPPGPPGEGDGLTQAYNFRMCLTDAPENQIPFTKPEGYDPIEYELVLRHVLGTQPLMLPGNQSTSGLFSLTPMPNRKTDSNNRNLFSTDYIGRSWDWPEASYEEREAIRKEHEQYIRGLFWFLANDPRVPAKLQAEVRRWGLAADEFTDNGNWPTQLYVREARRLIGEYVVTEHDCTRARVVDDPVALASYSMDSHCTSIFLDDQQRLRLEGAFYRRVRPYPVSFRAILPQRDDVANLLVPVCLSASHVAYGSIRMEPVFMMLAQSAATAAVLSIERGEDLHDLPYPVLRERLLADGQILDSGEPPPQVTATAPAAAVTVAAAAPTASPAAAQPSPDPELAATLDQLERRGIIHDRAYWYAHARPGVRVDGGRVGTLIVAAASLLEPAADLDTALAVLARRRVLTNTDLWNRQARPGQICNGGQVASLLSRFARTLPASGARPAPPAAAAPTPPSSPPPAVQRTVPDDPALAATLVRLEQLGIIDEKVYWYINARRGSQCDGARVGALLIAAASRFEPVTDVDAALEVLVRRRVLTRAEFWSKNARPGRTCSGGQVASLLSRLARSIR